MVRIVAEGNLAAKLINLREDAEIYDQDGQLLGFFQPARSESGIVPPGDPLYKTAVPDISDEELDRIEQEPGRPLAEIWERLKNL